MKTTNNATITLVIPGNLSVVCSVKSETARAMCLESTESPDARGSLWLPKSVLTRNEQYSYGSFVAYNLAPWFVRKMEKHQRRALGLLA